MPLNYSIFPQARNAGGGPSTLVNCSGAGAGEVGTHGVLASDTNSGAIAGPCLLLLTADEGQRVIVKKGSVPAATPLATGMKLVTNVPMAFDLGAGNWFLRWVAG